MLVGVDPQQLAAGAFVAVVDREARDHLRDHQSGPISLGLQAHEPVADSGERRQHDAIRDRRPRRGSSCRLVDLIGAPWYESRHEHPRAAATLDRGRPRSGARRASCSTPTLTSGRTIPTGCSQTPRAAPLRTARARERARRVRVPDARAGRLPGRERCVIAAAAESDGLLVPFCRVNPHDDARSPRRSGALDAGARGIKLHPRAEEFTLDHPSRP